MKSPILFLIFKRAETTKRVFERIREAQPPKLYIAADGPRNDVPDDELKCKEARKVVEVIDWPCEVHRLYRDENLGCGKGVSSAISWFFENEEQGIIIEDDILPHIDFFMYCDEMLEKYKNDERIQLISGTNYFYQGYFHKESYYMSSFMSIWGWASWRRVWETYDFNVNNLDEAILKDRLYRNLPRRSAMYFENVYKKMKGFEVDTWDFQLLINQQYYNRSSIAPFVNMVENIGFGSLDAAHTAMVNKMIVGHKAKTPLPVVHPQELTRKGIADFVAMINSGQYISTIYIKFVKFLFVVYSLFRIE